MAGEQRQHVVVRLAHVQDRRQRQGPRKHQLAFQQLLLAGMPEQHVVVLQADLADGEEAAASKQLLEIGQLLLDAITGLVAGEGVQAGAGEDAGMRARQRQGGLGVRDRGADAEHAADALGAGARKQVRQVRGQTRMGQVAVGVDQLHAGLALLRSRAQGGGRPAGGGAQLPGQGVR